MSTSRTQHRGIEPETILPAKRVATERSFGTQSQFKPLASVIPVSSRSSKVGLSVPEGQSSVLDSKPRLSNVEPQIHHIFHDPSGMHSIGPVVTQSQMPADARQAFPKDEVAHNLEKIDRLSIDSSCNYSMDLPDSSFSSFGSTMSPKENIQPSAIPEESCERHVLKAEDIQPVRLIRDIDQDKEGDIMYATEYIEEIMDHLFTDEAKKCANPDYMRTTQSDITPNMRSILVDWLVDVSEELRATSDTLYITIGLIDRFLSLEPVARKNLQLVGVACFFIASKFDEIYPVRVNDMALMTDNAYSIANILQMEVEILKKFKFEVSMPTSRYFLRRFILAYGFDRAMGQIAIYFCDLSLIDYRLVGFRPSCIAASCVALTALLLALPEIWNPTMVHYTRYRLADLKDCIHILCDILVTNPASRLRAIPNKFVRGNAQFVMNYLPTREHLDQLDLAINSA